MFSGHNKEFKFNTIDLRKKIEENRAEHEKIYAEAVENYESQVIAARNDLMIDLQNAKEVDEIKKVNLKKLTELNEPENHLQEYDRAIAILKMTTDQIIEMNGRDFSRYVLDQWEWTENWTMSNSVYLSKESYKRMSEKW